MLVQFLDEAETSSFKARVTGNIVIDFYLVILIGPKYEKREIIYQALVTVKPVVIKYNSHTDQHG